MINGTLAKIEETIRRHKNLSDKDRTELIELFGSLKLELKELSKIRAEETESLVGFIERSTHEASRQKKNPKLLKLSIDGISESVREFEVSHPKLVEDVNYISSVLSNMGI